jgi:hypothetical protein
VDGMRRSPISCCAAESSSPGGDTGSISRLRKHLLIVTNFLGATSVPLLLKPLNALYEAEERMRHGTVIDPGGSICIEREVCTDRVDTERYGKEWGTRYLASEGDAQVEMLVPDDIGEHNWPELYALGRGVRPNQMRRVLPNIIILLTDPRVIAAIEAHQC